jgi:predicted metal-binding membrane protein
MTPLARARARPDVIVALLASAGLAWWWTVERMAGMDAAPGADLGTLGWFAATWIVMMAAMMLPSLGPTLVAYVSPGRGRGHAARDALPFAGGYLLAWAIAGVIAYGLVELGKALLAGGVAWRDGGRWLSGGVIAAAAVYELIPFKRACLMRCRGPLGEVRRPAGRSWSRAMASGARGGGWCIGCSAALMAALFALGVMSVTWMAVIALLVAFEKLGPRQSWARVATASVLAVLAVGVIVAPHEVPGLVIPASPGMHAMSAMG